jgi:Mitochondrial pyruvate carriers
VATSNWFFSPAGIDFGLELGPDCGLLKVLSMVQVNYNLLAVNLAMAFTGIYQLSRKVRHDYLQGKEVALEKAA